MPSIGEIASLASALALIVAVVFGILQIRHMGKTRALFASAELVHAMQSTEFTRSIAGVERLPDAADPDLIRMDPATLAAVGHISHILETLGVLVYYRVVPIHVVDDLLGGYVRMCWRKLRPLSESRRREMGISYGEWMQWLAERLETYPSPGKGQGAHIAHKDWRP